MVGSERLVWEGGVLSRRRAALEKEGWEVWWWCELVRSGMWE